MLGARSMAPLRARGRLAVVQPLRWCSSASKSTAEPPRRETLAERNDRLREASEANLEKSRQKLCVPCRAFEASARAQADRAPCHRVRMRAVERI